MSEGKLLWCASEERKRSSNMKAFASHVASAHGVGIPDYAALHRFSIERIDDFWGALWAFADIRFDGDARRVRERGATMAEDRWFPATRLNFAENMLRPRPLDAEALVCVDEAGRRRVFTYEALLAEVARAQAALKDLGVGEGDRVVGYLPNIPEAVIAMLATNALGAIWAVVSPDISAQAAADRIGQLDPKVFILADGARHAGKAHDLLERAEAVAAAMPNLQACIVVGLLDQTPDLSRLPRASLWSERVGARRETTPTYRRLPFAAAAFVMFTSGTTGKPKCLVHSGGGVLMQFAKEHLLHADIREGDRVFRFTTTGWMMWNWGVGVLAWKATVVIYDGAPLYPRTEALFDLAQAERLTYFSPSAALLDAYVKAGLTPARTHDLGAMRTMYSGGMRVPARHYEYVYDQIKQDLFFASPSGGTDPMAAFVAGDPTGCVRAGEIACAALGMRMELLDEAGHALEHGPGEFVCASPFPSIPLAFWGDPDRARLLDTYFGAYPGRWSQGDWVERTRHGGYVVHGRSDATIKVRGIRIGTAEIYRPLEAIAEIEGSAAVEQAIGEETRLLLFVQLRRGACLDDGLQERIRASLRAGASAHHVPSVIAEAPGLPRNSAGKIMEVTVRDAIHGRTPRNLAAVVNPDCLPFFQAFSTEIREGDSR